MKGHGKHKRRGHGCRFGTDQEGGVDLVSLRTGSLAEVLGVRAGGKARGRLAALGLIPGSRLRVVANPGVGPLLLSVGESRIMVERGVAAQVLVDQQ